MERGALQDWVRKAVDQVGGQAELARQLSRKLRRGIDRAAVNKLVGGERTLLADEMLAIEEIAALPLPSRQPMEHHSESIRRVPLIDWVSAGKLTEPRSQIRIEDVPLLAFADLGSGDFFALQVEGNSMNRLSPEGSVILVNRADRTLVSGRCYVFALRGDTTYKRWQAGDPPYLAPFSTDPIHQPVFPKKKRDLEVIGRVKRTFLDL